jgi:hypothetical protein
MITAAPQTELSSLGHACVLLQQMPGAIRKAAEELGIVAVVVIDGREHFTAEDVERIRQHLAVRR